MEQVLDSVAVLAAHLPKLAGATLVVLADLLHRFFSGFMSEHCFGNRFTQRLLIAKLKLHEFPELGSVHLDVHRKRFKV